MSKLLLPLILVVFQVSALQAQIENIQYNQITQNDGLKSSSVTCILQDSKGFMWFGSKFGLSRFDGYNFVFYRNDETDTTSISGNYIIDLYEDKTGYLWISTQNGLNKFDMKTEKFRRFQHHHLLEPGENAWIMFMVPGQNNKLWCTLWSTKILQFDLEKETYSVIQLKAGESEDSFGGPITDIHEEENGMLWVGTFGGGLYKFDLTDNNKLITHYTSDSNKATRISNDSVVSIFQDKIGDIWIGTTYGLNIISSNKDENTTETLTQFYHDPNNPYSISHNDNFNILEDDSGVLWIKSLNGVNTYNRETGQFSAWKYEGKGIFSTEMYLALRTLYIDDEGIIWFGLINEGIYNFTLHNNKFNLIQHDPDNSNSLNNNGVTSIFQDTSGELWIGTESGLNRRIPGKKSNESHAWKLYKNDPANPNSISSNRIRQVYRDRQGVLWIGTVNGGLNKFIEQGNRKGQFKNFDFDTTDGIYRNTVDLFFEDKSNNFWLGTSIGLFLFDRETEKFYPYRADPDNPDSLSTGGITSIVEDNSGTIWYGSWSNGLFKASPPFSIKDLYVTGTQTISYRESDNVPNELGNWDIRSIVVPKVHKEHFLWIGTYGGGLYSLQKAKNSSSEYDEHFTNYSVSEGLSNYEILGIEEDKNGDLWVSTEHGLSRFNPETESFANYYKDKGINRDRFWWLSHYTSPTGELFYENDGLLSFFPDSIYRNLYLPPVVITKISVNNQTILVGDESPLDITVSEASEITLSHEQNFLSFEFVALNYTETERNRYKYILEGLEKDWVDAGTKRVASYQGLNPGTYTFRVIASNNDGVWNEAGTSLKITIKPPWWKTLVAYFSYLVVISIFIFFYNRYRTNKMDKEKSVLEEKVRERTLQLEEHKEELEQQKEELQQTLNYLKETQTQLVQSEKLASIGQLTAGIAHEINNPVNYISAGIDSLKTNMKEIRHILSLYQSITMEDFDEKLKIIREEEKRIDLEETQSEISSLIKSITNGTERTTEIVKGLRTFSRLDENEIKPVDIHEGIELTLVMLHNKFKHHVEIIKQYGEIPEVECFPGKLNQVFMNILSNAIEAIAEKGTITIRTWEDKSKSKAFISIKDDGMGMSDNVMSNIFNPFFTTKEIGKGTGLGMSISHGIIEQHKGELQVDSTPGKGAEFIISLPIKHD